MTMKISKTISSTAIVVAASVPVLFGSIVDLEAVQASTSALVCQYTFEGTYTTSGGTGTWLNQKAPSGSNLTQFPMPVAETNRTASQMINAYDNTSSYADFNAFGSGAKGAGLRTTGAVDLGTSWSVEYLVYFGAMTPPTTGAASRMMFAAETSGANARMRFTVVDATCDRASIIVGTNTPHNLIGGTAEVAYAQDNWYYVVETFTVADGQVTINAWVANLTNGGDLTQTIADATNGFDGTTSGLLDLGHPSSGTNTAADGGLDSIAIYNAVLDADTITAHFNSLTGIPEPAFASFAIGAFVMLIGCARRRMR